jgi:molybdopterin synthase catalytic subunit/molybdopterin synthase sulfur carrier subunit
MRILFFATTRDLAGCDSANWNTDTEQSAENLWNWLSVSFPALLPLKPSTRIARNGTWLMQGELLQPGDEVAVLPPVSGG